MKQPDSRVKEQPAVVVMPAPARMATREMALAILSVKVEMLRETAG